MRVLGGVMIGEGQRAPRWVDEILAWPWTGFAARFCLTSAYLLGGITKLFNFQAAVAEQQNLGLHPAWLWASLAIVIELVGPILIVEGRYAWLGAGALGVLTAIASYVANDFWNMTGAIRYATANTFFEHLGLIGGFALAAILAGREDGRRKQLRY